MKDNKLCFRLWGRYALFTDPITKTGGEKCSYHLPTYEALKGVCKSLYWKPTLTWHIDRVRIVKPIRTQTKSTKPLEWSGGNSLAIYTFLHDVEYQVEAHFEWNLHRPELADDRIDGKHFAIAQRMLERGGRQDVFLGTRDCQGYVEPCVFGEGDGHYDDIEELSYGVQFHSFGYPDETGDAQLISRFWRPTLKNGILQFPRTDDENLIENVVRPMTAKQFNLNENIRSVDVEEIES